MSDNENNDGRAARKKKNATAPSSAITINFPKLTFYIHYSSGNISRAFSDKLRENFWNELTARFIVIEQYDEKWIKHLRAAL